jgi:hypothetical protein
MTVEMGKKNCEERVRIEEVVVLVVANNEHDGLHSRDPRWELPTLLLLLLLIVDDVVA